MASASRFSLAILVVLAAMLPASAGPPLQLVPKDGRPAAGAKPDSPATPRIARPPAPSPEAPSAQQRPASVPAR